MNNQYRKKTPMSDRTVHAQNRVGTMELVRYDRAGADRKRLN